MQPTTTFSTHFMVNYLMNPWPTSLNVFALSTNKDDMSRDVELVVRDACCNIPL